MRCPHCNSENIDQTSKFDLTVIQADECRHDFECHDCGTLFQIVFHAVATKIVTPEELTVD